MLGLGPASAACLQANNEDQVAQGRLLSARITTAAYRLTEQAYLLHLSTSACLEGPDSFDQVEKADRIHVFAIEPGLRQRLRTFVGKSVVVHGNPFGEHTAHHHAPIVMQISKIDPL